VAQCHHDCWDTLQNKNNRKDVRAAQQRKSVKTRPELLAKLRSNNKLCLVNAGSDGEEVTSAGSVFHTWAKAMGKARSPTVDRRVEGTIFDKHFAVLTLKPLYAQINHI